MSRAADLRAFRHLACVASIALLAVMIYINTTDSPFTFDDRHNITENHRIRVREPELTKFMEAAFRSPTSTRPVANASFALNYLFGRYEVWGYHIVNIAIHAINGVLVYALMVVTMERTRRRNRATDPSHGLPSIRMALFAALLFTLHPIQTQSVAYVVQRMTAMAVMFYLAAMLLYIAGRRAQATGRRWALWAAGLFCWVAALGSKEIAVTLPLTLLLYELYFLDGLRRTSTARRFGSVLAVLAITAVPVWLFMNDRVLDFSVRDFDMGQRVLTQFRVVVFYASLVLFPHPDRLNLIHHIETSRSLLEPAATIAAVGLLTSLVLAALLLSRGHRLVSFGIVWFLIHLALESSIIRLEMIFEHRLYLPMVGASVCLVILIWYAQAASRSRSTLAGLGAALLLATATWHRNLEWRDPVFLWSDVISKNPHSERAHVDMGVAFADRGRFDLAILEYREAIRLKLNSETAHNNLGKVLLSQGRLDDAAVHFEEAIRIKPNHASAITNLGTLFRTRGDVDKAIFHYRRSLLIDPDMAQTHSNLGVALRSVGNVEAAIEHLRRALTLNPEYDDAHYNLGNALQSQCKTSDAIRHYREVLRLSPDYSEAHTNLGAAFLTTGKVDAAIVQFRNALALAPDDVEAHTNLGRALLLQGKQTEAADHFRRSISIDPDEAVAHSSLAAWYDSRGQLDDAVRHYFLALAIAPDNADDHFSLAFTLHRHGRVKNAITSYREAIRLRPQWPKPLTHLAWILSTHPDADLRCPQEAVDLAVQAAGLVNEKDAATLDTLAAAYAAARRYDEAVATAKHAYDLAVAAGNEHLAVGITQRVRLYKRRLPYRDRVSP